MHPDFEAEAKAITDLVGHYYWKRTALFSGKSVRALAIESALGWESHTKLSYVEGLDSEIASFLINKGFKPLGLRVGVFIGEGSATKSLLQALEVNRLSTPGYGYLLSQQSGWFTVD
jgi:hypothetical protein